MRWLCGNFILMEFTEIVADFSHAVMCITLRSSDPVMVIRWEQGVATELHVLICIQCKALKHKCPSSLIQIEDLSVNTESAIFWIVECTGSSLRLWSTNTCYYCLACNQMGIYPCLTAILSTGKKLEGVSPNNTSTSWSWFWLKV